MITKYRIDTASKNQSLNHPDETWVDYKENGVWTGSWMTDDEISEMIKDVEEEQ